MIFFNGGVMAQIDFVREYKWYGGNTIFEVVYTSGKYRTFTNDPSNNARSFINRSKSSGDVTIQYDRTFNRKEILYGIYKRAHV